VRKSANVHAFTTELLWPLTRPEGRHGFSNFNHRYFPAQPPPAPSVSKMAVWCVSITLGPYFSSYLRASRPYISLIFDPIALLPSPTSPSSTQASSTAPIDHAPTCAYRLLSFPICQLGSHDITPSHCFFSDDTLNPPCIIAPPAPASTDSSPVSMCQPLAIPNTTRCPLLFVYDGR
jgi:hypothetical protein